MYPFVVKTQALWARAPPARLASLKNLAGTIGRAV